MNFLSQPTSHQLTLENNKNYKTLNFANIDLNIIHWMLVSIFFFIFLNTTDLSTQIVLGSIIKIKNCIQIQNINNIIN